MLPVKIEIEFSKTAAQPSGLRSTAMRQLASLAPKSFALGNRSAQQQRNCATTRTARHSGREFIKRLPKKPLQLTSSESVGPGALFSQVFQFPGRPQPPPSS